MEVVNKIKVIENTNYGLLLSLLLLNNISEIEYIFPSYFDMKIVNKMSEKNIKIKISKYGTLKHNFFNHYFRTFKNILSFKNSNVKIYGNDHIDISIPYRKCDFYLIEDGLLNYTYHKNGYKKKSIKEKIKKIIKLLPSDKKCYGLRRNIKKIYLTGLAPTPEEIAHKVEIINLKELWNKKTLEEQNEILDIFSFDLNVKEKIKERDLILFTQPLSEDKVITEKEKIEIYSKIIKNIQKIS